MGTLVVPELNRLMNSGTPLTAQPTNTPTAMARKIQAVR